ncbi:hypothetical protein V2J09_018261 [Rumex salicifolius]
MSKPTGWGILASVHLPRLPWHPSPRFLPPHTPNRMALLNALIAPSLNKVLLSWYTPIYQSNFGKMPFTQRYMSTTALSLLISLSSLHMSRYLLNSLIMLEYGSLPCIFIGYSPKHKGYCFYQIPSATTYIVRHVIFYETNFPYSTLSSMPNDSSVSPQPASLPLHLLQHASRVTPMPSSLPYSSEPSPPSPLISAQPSPTTSHTVSSTPPSHPTTDQLPPSPSPPPIEPYPGDPSYYRVAANSKHTMVTRASTSSLKPKIFHTTKHPSPINPTVIIEPKARMSFMC